MALKLICILCYFLHRKVRSIVFSKYCSPTYRDLCVAYTELYLLLHRIQAKDAKVSFKNQHRLSVTVQYVRNQ